MTPSKFEVELLGRLSPTTWKTSLELGDEIVEQRKKDASHHKSWKSFVYPLFPEWIQEGILWPPGVGKMVVALANLEDQKVVESKWREEAPEKTTARSGHRLREYRLTEDGHRVRARVIQTKNQEIEGWVPRPV